MNLEVLEFHIFCCISLAFFQHLLDSSQRRLSASQCSYDQAVLSQGIQDDILIQRPVILITSTEPLLRSQVLGFGAQTFLRGVCMFPVWLTTFQIYSPLYQTDSFSIH